MSRPCPNCGTNGAVEARFCRLCGTPLKAAASSDGEPPVSPRAQTVPLSDEGRTTHGLETGDGGRPVADTHKVGRLEMESFLRRQPQAHLTHQKTNGTGVAHNEPGADIDAESYAAPDTAELVAPAGVNSDGASASTNATPVSASAEAESAQAVDGTGNISPDVKARARSKASGRRVWQVAAGLLLLVAVGAALLAFYYSRGTSKEGTAGTTSPISISDQKRLVEEKLAEAERLLAEGNTAEAIARLRYSVRLEPSNAKAHRLLAAALERTGAVNEAIDEYRVATQLDASDEQTWLRYADALRRIGRTDEAREIYQRLSSSSAEDMAREAKQQLAQLPSAQTAAAANSEQSRETRNASQQQNGQTENASATQTTQTTTTAPVNNGGSPAQRPQRNPDADYAEAMRIIEGRNIKEISRAELLRAYGLFQSAQSGSKGSDAARRVRELDKILWQGNKRRQ